MKARLNVEAGVPTVNNRVYTRELLQKLVDQGNACNVPVVDKLNAHDSCAKVANILGVARGFKLDEQGVVTCDLTMLYEHERVLQELTKGRPDKTVRLSMMVMGACDAKGVVADDATLANVFPLIGE